MKSFVFYITNNFGESERQIVIKNVNDKFEAFSKVHQEMRFDEFIINYEEKTMKTTINEK